MRNIQLIRVIVLSAVGLAGCSANPAYEPIFRDLVASMQRATAAMKNAHDANTLKTAAAILLTEADTVKELSKKLDQLGKPNSASKKSVKPHLDEIRSSESEFAEASKQFAKTVSTTRLSEEDRLAYAFAGMSFGQALERFGFNEKDFE